MTNDKRKRLEELFKEMYDLKIEYRTYGNIVVNALINIEMSKLDGDDAGLEIWTNIHKDYTDIQKMIKTRIKELHDEAIRLKGEMKGEK